VALRRFLGPHLAQTSIPRRSILLDRQVLRVRGDFERILVHELFHFAWVRLTNAARRSWERCLAREIGAGAAGELGWSSEWRKERLQAADWRRRTPAWRRYACESFCDTAAWLYAGLKRHQEFTLGARWQRRRRSWFERRLPGGPVGI
jgi:hypothetical protein